MHKETDVAGKGIAIGSAIQEKNGELIQFEILVLFPVDTGVLLKTLKTGIRGIPQSVTV